jgi:sugar lactone lactonase YvrE/transposase
MPWRSDTLLEARNKFVQLALASDASFQSLCRRFNISRQTGYRTLERYRTAGVKGLESQSRRPHRSPQRCPALIEENVLSVRADHLTWGARKIAFHLRSLGRTDVPAPSTITAILARHGRLKGSPDQSKFLRLLGQLHNPISKEDLPTSLNGHPDLTILIEKLERGRHVERRRALAVVAASSGLRTGVASRVLKQCRRSYMRSVRLFEEGGAALLFAPRVNPHRKFDSEQVKEVVFKVLHQPPSSFGINRTTWKMADLVRVMKETGQPAGEGVIRTIVKRAGYRWRLSEDDNHLSVFRYPSFNSNGNTIDREGRLITCEHGGRRVTRTELDGSVTIIADRYNGKRLNSPNDAAVASDGSIWFTDPAYGIGGNYEGLRDQAEQEKHNVYRVDPKSDDIKVIVDDFVEPNGITFSPDEKKLYVIDSGFTDGADNPSHIRVFDVDVASGRLSNGKVFAEMPKPSIADGMRADTDGNIWCSMGWGNANEDGVRCYNPSGELLGKIHIPETVANLCFGGSFRNRLYICGSTSLYAL